MNLSFSITSKAASPINPVGITHVDSPQTQEEANTKYALSNGNSTVNISTQAREKLRDEMKNALNDQTEKKQEAKAKNSPEETENKELEQLDKLIEKTKEQIKEIQQQLSELRNDKSEQAEQQIKALESQLGSLNATLLGLMGKKLKLVEESAQ